MRDPLGARSLLPDLSLLGAAVAWGATFPLGKLVLGPLGPFTYLAARFVIASLVLLPFALPGVRRLGRRTWSGLLVGMVLFSIYAFQTLGLRLTSSSNAALITGLNMAIIPVLSIAWLRRAPSPLTAAGVVLATAGLVLLTRGPGLVIGAGDLLVLACAVGIAVQVLLVGALAGAMPSLALAFLQIAAVAVLSAGAALAVERPALAWPGWTWAAVAGMAVAATAYPFLAQAWAQRYTSPTRTGLLLGFEPAAGVLLSAAILGERLRGAQAAGSALILLGIVIAEIGRRGRETARAEG